MSREGEARRPTLLQPPKRSPRPSLLPTVSRPCCLPCLSAVCRSAATASPPVRAGFHAPLPVKAAERSGAPEGLP